MSKYLILCIKKSRLDIFHLFTFNWSMCSYKLNYYHTGSVALVSVRVSVPLEVHINMLYRYIIILLYYIVIVNLFNREWRRYFSVPHMNTSDIYIPNPQIEWKIIFCCYHCDISEFNLRSSSCWRGNMKYYLRKALLTIIWLLCSFQVAQLWLDPTIIARSSVMELALISVAMVVIAAAFHWGITRAIKFWYALQRIHILNQIHNLRSLICQA